LLRFVFRQLRKSQRDELLHLEIKEGKCDENGLSGVTVMHKIYRALK
jgi:hypothetical protein